MQTASYERRELKLADHIGQCWVSQEEKRALEGRGELDENLKLVVCKAA
jgi:hypothetical protein